MIKIKGGSFRDEHDRQLILRGVNLGGSTKVPYTPNGATYIREGFFNHREVSFVGRPFPLEEADEHFTRLKTWGLDFLRFLVTWEAIEHAGPGKYDEEYLDYIYQIIKKAAEYEINLFIDPHQDVWSRFSGGDGAPGWTFEAAGMDMQNFAETGAAVVHNIHGDPYPKMIWGTNYTKLAAATMFTLFFGGNDFAPNTKVDGEPVQEYLQRHYIDSIKQVALRLKDLPNVIGYDVLNELSSGFIGWPDLSQLKAYNRKGPTPSPFQAMALGEGNPQVVGVWDIGMTGVRKKGTTVIDSRGARAWQDGHCCIWKEHGVWDKDAEGKPQLLRPDYFAKINGREVDFNRDYLKPFIARFTSEIRSVSPDTFIFVEHEVGDEPPHLEPEECVNMVYAQHWYDVITLIMKKYLHYIGIDVDRKKPVLGPKRIAKSYARQLKDLKRRGYRNFNCAPTVVGEIGIAYDLNNKKAYTSGDFSLQVKAMDRSMRALETNHLNYTIWNYTADNTNERGDLWNDEDLSIFSRDQQNNPADINSGGRALKAVVRPFARKTAGTPIFTEFDLYKGTFKFAFRHDTNVTEPTVLFVPNLQFPDGYEVKVSDGTFETNLQEQTLLYYYSDEEDIHKILITRKK